MMMSQLAAADLEPGDRLRDVEILADLQRGDQASGWIIAEEQEQNQATDAEEDE